MLWYIALVWICAQIACKAFKRKRDKTIRARKEKRRRREFKALYRVG